MAADKKPDAKHGGFSPKPVEAERDEAHSGQGVDTVDIHKDRKSSNTNPESPAPASWTTRAKETRERRTRNRWR